MRSSDYWRRRFELLEQQSVTDATRYLQDLSREWAAYQRATENAISGWYQRLAANNDVSLAEARRLLNTRELAEFRWTVEDYIRYGRENALNRQWIRQLENASARAHISRLEAAQIEMRQSVESLYTKYSDGAAELNGRLYSDSYARTAYEVQKGIGQGWAVQALPPSQIDRVLSRPWTADGLTFSDRIWRDQARLVSTLETKLTQSIIRGESPDKLIDEIAHEFEVSKSRAGTLIMTERAYFASRGQEDSFNALEVEEYEIVATLDSSTSEICQDMDGKTFDMSVFEPGVTAPPFHPRCRTTTAPADADDAGERAARGKDGKTEYVPGDMTYKQWADKYLTSPDAPKPNEKVIGALKDYADHVAGMPEPYKSVYSYYGRHTEVVADTEADGAFGYRPKVDQVVYNPDMLRSSPLDVQTALDHEFAHRYDVLRVKSWTQTDFVQSIGTAAEQLALRRPYFEELLTAQRDLSPALQDIFSALSKGDLMLQYGHDPAYWSNPNNTAIEIFANLAYLKANKIAIIGLDGLLDEIIAVFEGLFEEGMLI